MNLSTNFTLDALTHSQTALRQGIDNSADPATVDRLTHLCVGLLEPARRLLGVPIQIDSGFRCLQLNRAVGGSATSAHCYGCAADLIPQGMDLRQAFDMLRHSELPYDQIILECNAWIHLALPRPGAVARKMALTAAGGPGRWTYSEVHDA